MGGFHIGGGGIRFRIKIEGAGDRVERVGGRVRICKLSIADRTSWLLSLAGDEHPSGQSPPPGNCHHEEVLGYKWGDIERDEVGFEVRATLRSIL